MFVDQVSKLSDKLTFKELSKHKVNKYLVFSRRYSDWVFQVDLDISRVKPRVD